MNKSFDQLFSKPLSQVPDFVFNEEVVNVFPDMIKRSIPGYSTVVENIGILAQYFTHKNSILYDLGCSLGAVSQSLRRHVTHDNCRVVAIDSSKAMVTQCQAYMRKQESIFNQLLPIQVIEADINNFKLESTPCVVLNFTLQFIAPKDRLKLLTQIHQAMKPGGALILSEKVHFKQQQLLTDLHLSFKKSNGYSDLEIAQKRSAIENIMITDSQEQHIQRLKAAGFSQVVPWFQCMNFVSMIALA